MSHTAEKPYACKHCKMSFSRLSDCKRHERTHSGEKLYTCKHCITSFSRLSSCKRHEEKHAIDSSLKHKQPSQDFKLRKHKEPSTTRGSKGSGVLISLTEENLSQVEDLICWICQEELSSRACLIKHYDYHVR